MCIRDRINVIKEQINSAKNNESYINQRIGSITEEIEQQNKELDNSQVEREENENKLNEIVEVQTKANNEIAEENDKIKLLEREIEENKAEIIELLNAKSIIKTKIQRCDTLLEQINIRKSQLNQKLIDFQSRKDGQESAIKQFEEQLIEVNAEIDKVQSTLTEYKDDLANLRIENSKLTKDLSANQEKYHKLKSNLEALKNITERYEGCLLYTSRCV